MQRLLAGRNPDQRLRTHLPLAFALALIACTVEQPSPSVPASAASGTQALPEPEIRITEYLLRPPSDLSQILGAERRRVECADTDGTQIEYDHGYACIQEGRVVLLGYNLRTPVSSPQEALQAVGLSMRVQPQHPGGVAYIWTKALGNPLPVGDNVATRVTVVIGGSPAVIVNLGRE